jgi:hypothetical protein
MQVFSLVICFFFLASCTQPQEQPTLDREKAASILADIFIADAAVASGYGPVRDSMQAYYYNQIFEMHQISREEFEHQLSLYTRSVVEMDSIMQMADRKLKHEN